MKKLRFVVLLLYLLSIFGVPQVKAQLFNHNEDKQTEFQYNRNSLRGGDQGEERGGGGGEPTPIGSGLLALTCLSLGYAWSKHSRNEDWIIFSSYTEREWLTAPFSVF